MKKEIDKKKGEEKGKGIGKVYQNIGNMIYCNVGE